MQGERTGEKRSGGESSVVEEQKEEKARTRKKTAGREAWQEGAKGGGFCSSAMGGDQ